MAKKKIDPKFIAVYRQDWHAFTRFIFINGGGSIQINLEPALKGINDDEAAWIYGLWIDKPMRRKGFATALMERAEKIAKEEGYKKVCLEWKEQDSPCEIFNWYIRRGYEVKEKDKGCALLVKELNK